MKTRVVTTPAGLIIVQYESKNPDSATRWRKAAGPFCDKKTARQGELRYLKKHTFGRRNSLRQQVVSRNWSDIKF